MQRFESNAENGVPGNKLLSYPGHHRASRTNPLFFPAASPDTEPEAEGRRWRSSHVLGAVCNMCNDNIEPCRPSLYYTQSSTARPSLRPTTARAPGPRLKLSPAGVSRPALNHTLLFTAVVDDGCTTSPLFHVSQCYPPCHHSPWFERCTRPRLHLAPPLFHHGQCRGSETIPPVVRVFFRTPSLQCFQRR